MYISDVYYTVCACVRACMCVCVWLQRSKEFGNRNCRRWAAGRNCVSKRVTWLFLFCFERAPDSVRSDWGGGWQGPGQNPSEAPQPGLAALQLWRTWVAERKKAQWQKVDASKPDDLSLIPGTQMVQENTDLPWWLTGFGKQVGWQGLQAARGRLLCYWEIWGTILFPKMVNRGQGWVWGGRWAGWIMLREPWLKSFIHQASGCPVVGSEQGPGKWWWPKLLRNDRN